MARRRINRPYWRHEPKLTHERGDVSLVQGVGSAGDSAFGLK